MLLLRRRTLAPATAGGSAADVKSTVFALRRSLALAPAAAGSSKGAAGSSKGAAGSSKGAAGSPSPASSSSTLSCSSPPAAAAAKAWTAACAEVSDAPASFHCRFATTAL